MSIVHTYLMTVQHPYGCFSENIAAISLREAWKQVCTRIETNNAQVLEPNWTSVSVELIKTRYWVSEFNAGGELVGKHNFEAADVAEAMRAYENHCKLSNLPLAVDLDFTRQ